MTVNWIARKSFELPFENISFRLFSFNEWQPVAISRRIHICSNAITMLKLAPGLHSMIDGRVIILLQDKSISTVYDVLRTDSNVLRQIANIDLVSVAKLKSDLWKLTKIWPINGLQHYGILNNQSSYIPTGIHSLDELLGGGLLSGNVIDLCGTSGSGKTQFYTTIALNWAINQDHETFVVDTKGDFSGDRINRILLNRTDFNADKRKQIMRNIRYEKCGCPFKLIELLSNLLDCIHLYPKFKLLVIDSLPALWFLFHGNKRSLGNRKLATAADLLRRLAVEHAIVVLTVNLETRTVVTNGDENAIDETDRNDADLMNRTSQPIVSEVMVPALGKHWKSICSLRLQIQKPHSTFNQPPNERTIRILKSNQIQTDVQCVMHLTDAGCI